MISNAIFEEMKKSSIKKVFFNVSLLLVFIVFQGQNLNAQEPVDLIKQSFKSGDAKMLADFFNQNIELVVLDNDNVYSKAQAQQIVSKFFEDNPPQEFNLIHQGGKEGAQYVIGNLVTGSKSFRVYFLLKKNGAKDYIHQLRIEEQ